VSALSSLRGIARVEFGDELVSEVASGMADDASLLLCTPDVRFQLSSISKQFTAAAVLLLSDSGVLSVEDPVARWIDGCPTTWQTMTIEHLLTHSSGLPHWFDLPEEITLGTRMDPARELSIIQRAFLRSEPGRT